MEVESNAPAAATRSGALRLILRLGGLVASLWLLSEFIDLREPIEALSRLQWPFAAAVLAMATARAAMTATRWWWMTPAESGLTIWKCFRLLMIGGALGLFLPGVVGGDVGRSVFVLKEVRADRSGALVSMFADRFVGLFSVLILGFTACLLTDIIEHNLLYAGFLACLLAGLIGLAWVGLHPRVQSALIRHSARLGALGERLRSPLERVTEALTAYRDRPGRVLVAFLFCLPIHLLSFLIVWVGAQGLGVPIGLLTIAAVLSIVWVITMLPVSIGGLGVRELSFVFLLAGSGVSEAEAGSLGLLVSAVIVTFALAGVPLIWLGGPRAATLHALGGPVAHQSVDTDRRPSADKDTP